MIDRHDPKNGLGSSEDTAVATCATPSQSLNTHLVEGHFASCIQSKHACLLCCHAMPSLYSIEACMLALLSCDAIIVFNRSMRARSAVMRCHHCIQSKHACSLCCHAMPSLYSIEACVLALLSCDAIWGGAYSLSSVIKPTMPACLLARNDQVRHLFSSNDTHTPVNAWPCD
jgi:hypothetical protein